MTKKLKNIIGFIMIFVFVVLFGYERKFEKELEIVLETNEKIVHWVNVKITDCWYGIELTTRNNLNADENGESIDLTKFPYTILKNQRTSNEHGQGVRYKL